MGTELKQNIKNQRIMLSVPLRVNQEKDIIEALKKISPSISKADYVRAALREKINQSSYRERETPPSPPDSPMPYNVPFSPIEDIEIKARIVEKETKETDLENNLDKMLSNLNF